MDEQHDVEAVVVPPQESGLLLLTGAAELVTDAILGLYLELDYVQREVSQDGAGVRCVRVDPDDEPLDEVQRRIWSALADLIASTPELAGWTPRVRLGETSHDDDEDAPELDDIEALAEHLLPSGDELLDSLMHDIQRERHLRRRRDLRQPGRDVVRPLHLRCCHLQGDVHLERRLRGPGRLHRRIVRAKIDRRGLRRGHRVQDGDLRARGLLRHRLRIDLHVVRPDRQRRHLHVRLPGGHRSGQPVCRAGGRNLWHHWFLRR